MSTKDRYWLVLGGVMGVLVSLKIWDNLELFLFFVSIMATIMLSALGYVTLRLRCSRPIRSVDFLPKSVLEMQRLLLDQSGLGEGSGVQEEKAAPKISRNIDQALNDILDLASKDYVFYWFGHLMMNQSISEEKLKRDLWHVISSLKDRVANTDHVKILAIDLVKRVCCHFEKIRLIQENRPSSSKQAPNFHVSPHLMSTEREMEYLGKVSEALIIFLFPSSYGSCLPIRHILREVFARHLLYPAIDLITNPDSINVKILSWIQKNQSVKEMDKKTFIYADSFEEFVTMITTTNDIAEIKQMRYNILTEIMQATTMNNLRKAKGSIPHLPDEGLGGSRSKKAHLMSPQNMKRYINQMVHVKVSVQRPLMKRIEAFLIGDDGPEVFFELQASVMISLQETYFPAFLFSDKCYLMLEEIQEMEDIQGDPDKDRDSSESRENSSSTNKPEPIEAWAEHLGRWRCHVQAVEQNEDKETLQAYLIIHIPLKREDSEPSPLEFRDSEGFSSSTAWSCIRKVTEFHNLQRELVPYVPWIKNLELPSNSKSIFSRNSNNRAALEKARVVIQRYMDSVLANEHLNQSEIVYAFLSPSPQYLKTMRPLSPTISGNSKSNFSPFSNFFNNKSAEATKKEDLTEEEFWLDELDSSNRNEDNGKDVIAESLYGLIGEVFDMRGVFKWMRKSLMTFVQITYGSTINRQVRETVGWLTSEQMILYYLHSFKKSFWPLESKNSPPERTANQKLHIRQEAKEALLHNIPEVLVNLVGQQAAVNGTTKVFEVLQNATLNRQLLYDTGACLYLNLLSWKRVEIPKNDPDTLPLAGGILQKNSSTYVATRPDLIDDHFVKVGPSFKEHFMQIVFDFLEHQNPDVRFSRQWVLSKDKFVGSKEEMIASFSPALTTSLNHNKELLASPISLVQKIRHGSNENDEMSPLKELPTLERNPEEELRASSKPTILLPKSKEVSLKSVQTRKLQPLVPLFGRRECPSNKVIYFKVYLPEISNKEHSLSAINNQEFPAQT
ncbi:hypothetical protein TCAL_10392 [Tigriopus californicus]|uniref:PXA domain-containing protein n=1 Tax=Tigriopus californicus TaxID=6832 RepID=A0A553P2C4_TIGCA|nr:hypothetical protein TCAL_10392 [Tigriopus californicus]